MYAIVEIAGKQYKIAEGSVVDVDRLNAGKNEVNLEKVLMLVSDNDIRVGNPVVSNVQITAEIIDENVKGDKVIVFKWRRYKNSRKRAGHRHQFNKIKIKKIEVLN